MAKAIRRSVEGELIRPGNKFGHLTLTKYAGKNPDGYHLWYCICDCGRFCKKKESLLKRESAISCGCRGKGFRAPYLTTEGVRLRARLHQIERENSWLNKVSIRDMDSIQKRVYARWCRTVNRIIECLRVQKPLIPEKIKGNILENI